MSVDDIVRLSVVTRVARRHLRGLAALAVVGALLGSAVWLVLAPGWTAASEVLLIGAVEQEEISAEEQIASSLTVLDRTADAVGGGTGADLRDRVQVSVVEGSVLRIAGTAGSPEAAARLTEAATDAYMGFSAELVGQAANAATAVLDRRRADLEQRVEEIRNDIAALQGTAVVTDPTPDGTRARAELDRLGDTLTSTTSELSDVEGRVQEAAAEAAAGKGRFAVLESAVSEGPAAPTVVTAAVAGFVGLPALGLLALLVARHTDRRLRDPLRIGEALGVPVLADPALAVLVADTEGTRPLGLRALLAVRRPAQLVALLRHDGAHPAPADRPEDPARLRRVLDRVPAPADAAASTVLLVPAGDALARSAAEGMVAGRDPAPAIVEVDLDHPRPEPADGPAEAVVVVPVGAATAWQLLGLAAAAAESGPALRGAVVVTAAAATDPPAASAPPPDGEPPADGAEPSDAAMAGSA
ncbi:hypothetical protein ACFFTK_00565 [Pseudonocardia petroleophila]|uniref:Chain length determinant protein n=1 Tax=Pseudonocardia petroleophila TaxID=37331 RepID=A0A7G7MQH8_9PSEU|nr:hypothetical protein [Pseudonocardia petroleophila]QNG55039.1 hypothetical protein H6H00_14910 [Pseudonocardia petroleophila]